MQVIDPGHDYILNKLDNNDNLVYTRLTFVKREGEGYPGNVGHHSGTTTQEVLRALIDRTKYVDKQEPCGENSEVLYNLRYAIYFLEERAADRHGRILNLSEDDIYRIEEMPTCEKCGHIGCQGECREDGKH